MSDSEFSLMERRDEAQILAELQGQVIEEYFYVSKNKTIISYTGVKEISREYKNNVADLVDMRETDEAWIVTCKATDTERNITRLGVSTQNKLEKVYQYTGPSGNRTRVKDAEGKDVYTLEPDEFCLQKAFSKSQRNAIKILLPVTIITKAIEAWQAQKKGGKTTTTKPRQEPASDVNVTDYMKPAEIVTPDSALIDELARVDGNWDVAENLTKEWMVEAHLNPESFQIKVDRAKITVVPKKVVPADMKPRLEQLMAHGGFLPTKVKKANAWRLNKQDMTG